MADQRTIVQFDTGVDAAGMQQAARSSGEIANNAERTANATERTAKNGGYGAALERNRTGGSAAEQGQPGGGTVIRTGQDTGAVVANRITPEQFSYLKQQGYSPELIGQLFGQQGGAGAGGGTGSDQALTELDRLRQWKKDTSGDRELRRLRELRDREEGGGSGGGGRGGHIGGGRAGMYYGGLGRLGAYGYMGYQAMQVGQGLAQSYFGEDPILAQGYGQGTLSGAAGASIQVRQMRDMRWTEAGSGLARTAGMGLSAYGGASAAAGVMSGTGVGLPAAGAIVAGVAITEIASVFRTWRESQEREISAKQTTALSMFEQAMGSRMQMAGTTLGMRAMGRKVSFMGNNAPSTRYRNGRPSTVEEEGFGDLQDTFGYSSGEVGQLATSFGAAGGRGPSLWGAARMQRAYGISAGAYGSYTHAFAPGMGAHTPNYFGAEDESALQTLGGAQAAGIDRSQYEAYLGRITGFNKARGEAGGDVDTELSEGRRQGLIGAGLQGYQAQHVIESSQRGMGGIANSLRDALMPPDAMQAISMARLLQRNGGNIGKAMRSANEMMNTQGGVDFGVETARMFPGAMGEAAMSQWGGLEAGSAANRKALRGYGGGVTSKYADVEGALAGTMEGDAGTAVRAQAQRENMKNLAVSFGEIAAQTPLLAKIMKGAVDNLANIDGVLKQVYNDLAEMTGHSVRHDYNAGLARQIGGANGAIFGALSE